MELLNVIELFIQQAGTSNIFTKEYPKIYGDLIMKISFGKGIPARVPWIAFLKKDAEIRFDKYPIILLYKSFHELVISYGIGNSVHDLEEWVLPNNEQHIKIGEYFREKNTKKIDYANSLYHYSIKNYDKKSIENLIDETNYVIDVYKKYN